MSGLRRSGSSLIPPVAALDEPSSSSEDEAADSSQRDELEPSPVRETRPAPPPRPRPPLPPLGPPLLAERKRKSADSGVGPGPSSSKKPRRDPLSDDDDIPPPPVRRPRPFPNASASTSAIGRVPSSSIARPAFPRPSAMTAPAPMASSSTAPLGLNVARKSTGMRPKVRRLEAVRPPNVSTNAAASSSTQPAATSASALTGTRRPRSPTSSSSSSDTDTSVRKVPPPNRPEFRARRESAAASTSTSAAKDKGKRLSFSQPTENRRKTFAALTGTVFTGANFAKTHPKPKAKATFDLTGTGTSSQRMPPQGSRPLAAPPHTFRRSTAPAFRPPPKTLSKSKNSKKNKEKDKGKSKDKDKSKSKSKPKPRPRPVVRSDEVIELDSEGEIVEARPSQSPAKSPQKAGTRSDDPIVIDDSDEDEDASPSAPAHGLAAPSRSPVAPPRPRPTPKKPAAAAPRVNLPLEEDAPEEEEEEDAHVSSTLEEEEEEEEEDFNHDIDIAPDPSPAPAPAIQPPPLFFPSPESEAAEEAAAKALSGEEADSSDAPTAHDASLPLSTPPVPGTASASASVPPASTSPEDTDHETREMEKGIVPALGEMQLASSRSASKSDSLEGSEGEEGRKDVVAKATLSSPFSMKTRGDVDPAVRSPAAAAASPSRSPQVSGASPARVVPAGTLTPSSQPAASLSPTRPARTRKPVPQMSIRGSLYSGSDGFFKVVHRSASASQVPGTASGASLSLKDNAGVESPSASGASPARVSSSPSVVRSPGGVHVVSPTSPLAAAASAAATMPRRAPQRVSSSPTVVRASNAEQRRRQPPASPRPAKSGRMDVDALALASNAPSGTPEKQREEIPTTPSVVPAPGEDAPEDEDVLLEDIPLEQFSSPPSTQRVLSTPQVASAPMPGEGAHEGSVPLDEFSATPSTQRDMSVDSPARRNTDSPARGASRPARRKDVVSELGRTILEAQFKAAEDHGDVIDLTMTDDEDETRLARPSDEDAALDSLPLFEEIFEPTDRDVAMGEIERELVGAGAQDVVSHVGGACSPKDEAATSAAGVYQIEPSPEQRLDEDEERHVEDMLNGLAPRVETPSTYASTPEAETSGGPSTVRPRVPLPRRNPRRNARRGSSSASSTSLAELPELPRSNPRIIPSRTRSGVTEQLVPALDEVHLSEPDGELLTWEKDGARFAREFADVYQLAKDIPHDLQDHVNSMNEFTRENTGLRMIFESMMSENTTHDEPCAPDIAVVNYVDDEETPPFEFHYSNRMWHGKGVPKPDLDNLKGCGCRGPCDPKSTTCSCIKATKAKYEHIQGFIYDSNGRIKEGEIGWPIRECNMFCGCDDDCVNRVVQRGRKIRVNIQKTYEKGWGIFAVDRIPAYTYVGIYAGEYLTDKEGHQRGQKYDAYGKTYLFDVDFWYIEPTKYCIDAYHVGNFTRYLNHSCDPNCQLVPCYINEANEDKPLMAIFTRRDVRAGEELCFSYTGLHDDDEEKASDTESEVDVRDDPIFQRCRCGTAKCTGKMWL